MMVSTSFMVLICSLILLTIIGFGGAICSYRRLLAVLNRGGE